MLSRSERSYDCKGRGKTLLVTGAADWLTGSTPTLCAVHSSSSRDSCILPSASPEAGLA